ncbi:hypothetical protein NTE_02085 [Candidatus Nitrososphaera evergladensis SR1]|jgi:hypothetical protein|uniref:Uncharacterized protein n=1 Tax=Candidatus Nitrososphaera evergladensis SR1 TaxID=1459636 RepID=A0A075MRG5_9ARCH|nr:hypothetical protein NTE_02085 [Candidatus Nitrososphaera evergladensis SR1]
MIDNVFILKIEAGLYMLFDNSISPKYIISVSVYDASRQPESWQEPFLHNIAVAIATFKDILMNKCKYIHH